MKKFDLHLAASSVRRAMLRFPVVVMLCAAVTALILMFVEGVEFPGMPQVIAMVIFATPLALAATLFAETGNKWAAKKYIWSAFFILTGAYALYALRFEDFVWPLGLQTGLWCAAAVLLILCMPLAAGKRGDKDPLGSFWTHDLRLALAAVTASAYGAITYIGLSTALLSLTWLFDLDVELHFQLWILITCLGIPYFFLSLVPESARTKAEDVAAAYPKELRRVSLYVLLPVTAVYFLILYAYTAKILIVGEWPRGVVSALVLSFSGLALLSYVLLYPLTSKAGSRMRKVSSLLMGLVFPQAIVLLIAVGMRVSEYGITESRYGLLVAGGWLLAVSAYFVIRPSSRKDIRLIPVSVLALVLLASFGPWGALAVSRSSQLDRLEALVAVLEDGGHEYEIREISRYLYSKHGSESFARLIPDPAGRSDLHAIVTSLGVRPEHEDFEDLALELTAGQGDAFSVKGYDYFSDFMEEPVIDGKTYSFESDYGSQEVIVYRDGEVLARVSIAQIVGEEARQLATAHADEEYEMPLEQMSVAFENQSIRLKVYVPYVRWDQYGQPDWNGRYVAFTVLDR